MWVIYRKNDLKIMGLSADCEPDLEKDIALEEIVKGLVESRPIDDYDAIQVTDRVKVRTYFSAFPERLVLREGKKGELQLAIEVPKIFTLTLQCDASDAHPVDGIPEIKADGNSFTTISIQKVDQHGKPQKGREDNDLLYLRTDYGILRSSDGKREINSIKLKKGETAFRLVSETTKRVATVQVFNADPILIDNSICIEFI